MISQPQIYLDDQPTVWLPRLVEWADHHVSEHTIDAQVIERQGNLLTAADSLVTAARYRRYGDRARVRLAYISRVVQDNIERPKHNHSPHCPITDCAEWLPQDEPPSTLVPFVAWLRGKLGRWFPTMPSEIWQGIGFVLLHHRRQP